MIRAIVYIGVLILAVIGTHAVERQNWPLVYSLTMWAAAMMWYFSDRPRRRSET